MMAWPMARLEHGFQSIHDAYRPKVLRYLTRLAGVREAEDLTQIVMLKISAGLPDFRGESSLATWIYRIATHAAIDRLRSPQGGAQEPQGEAQEQLLADSTAPSAESTAIRGEMNACIRGFVERLPESYKSVVILSEFEGFENQQIATILGISLDAVKMRLHRAREKLRQDLQTGCSFHRGTHNELACDRAAAVAPPPPRPC